MGDYREVFVGIDVAKSRNAIALADRERGGEIRYIGEADASEVSMRRVVKRIAAEYYRVQFCMKPDQQGTVYTDLSRLLDIAVSPPLHLSFKGNLAIGSRPSSVTP